MGYVRAEEILPEELIKLIQQYIDGTNIYIPRKDNRRAAWGQVNQAKERLYERDREIYKAYKEGRKVPELAEMYFLSEKSIQRILRKMKNID